MHETWSDGPKRKVTSASVEAVQSDELTHGAEVRCEQTVLLIILTRTKSLLSLTVHPSQFE